jgi:hypothetical protein
VIVSQIGRAAARVLFSPLERASINRVGRLRGYGNDIVPEVAAAFVTAFLECAA